MTGFIAYVFLSLNRVSFQEAFEALEPDDGKLSRPVLRGPGLSNGVRPLDPYYYLIIIAILKMLVSGLVAFLC
jgi:hypothetical protein